MTTTPTPYQLFAPLPDDDYQVLKADIARQGILVPVEVDEQNNILDGHHRVRAWTELRAEGIKVPEYDRLVRSGLSEADKRNHIRTVNLLRRHLTKEQLQEQVLAMRSDGATLQQIADATGISRWTVGRELENPTCANAQVAVPATVVGRDGKARPTHYAPRKPQTGFARNTREQTKVAKGLGGPQAPAGNQTVTAHDVRERRNHAPTAPVDERPRPNQLASRMQLYHGRFQDTLAALPDASVDLILTDPPYVKAFLPEWSDLSALAARVLKPDGWLVTYSGQTYLPEVMRRLGEHLTYWWLGAIFHGGASAIVLADQPVRKVVNRCKPLLFYVREGFRQNMVLDDALIGTGPDKDSHAWQQGLSEAEFYISRLCPEDGVVVDPCLGGGTTALAAKHLNRQFVGCEVDAASFEGACTRVR